MSVAAIGRGCPVQDLLLLVKEHRYRVCFVYLLARAKRPFCSFKGLYDLKQLKLHRPASGLGCVSTVVCESGPILYIVGGY